VGDWPHYAVTNIMGLNAPDVTAAKATLGWQIKIGLILFPAIIFGVIVLGQQFPITERVKAGVSTRQMFREALHPMFLLWFGCMWLTAASEVAPGQW